MWWICHLRADSVVWLSHTSSIWPLSGAPKVLLYDTFLGSLRHLPPQMKNQHGLIEEKTLYRKKIISQLSGCDVTCVVSLDTNNQVWVSKESGELREICNLLLSLLVDFTNQMVFVLLCSLVILDLFFKWCYSPDIYPFQFVPHWTLIVCSFILM